MATNDVYEQTDKLYDENHYIDLWLKNLGTSPVQQNNDWNEERMEIVGQNGNDGLHYQPQSVEYYPPGSLREVPVSALVGGNMSNEYKDWVNHDKQKDKEFLDKLIKDHWNYIEGVLDKAGTYPTALAEIEYHYKTAFSHGWRHAKEFYTGTHD